MIDFNNSNLPNVEDVVESWSILYTGYIIRKEMNENGLLIETKKPLRFYGNIQPAEDQELILKTEGERNWAYYLIFTTYNFKNEDLIKINKKLYKIRKKTDFNQYGYNGYEAIEEYE